MVDHGTLHSDTLHRLKRRAEQENCSIDVMLTRLLDAVPENDSPCLPFSTRLLDKAPSTVIITDARQPDQPIVYVNEYFEKETGYTSAEVMGLNPRFLQGEDHDQPELDRVRLAQSEGTTCNVVLRNYRKDGTLFWNELRIAPIYDERGQITHYIGIQYDVSWVQLAQQAMSYSEKLYRLLAENSRDAISLHLVDGQLTYVNPAYTALTGYSTDELLSMTADDVKQLVHPDDQQITQQGPHEKLLKGEVVELLEYRLQRKDGEIAWVQSHAVPILNDEGQVKLILVSRRDITRRRMVEQALRQSEERYRLLSDLALEGIALHQGGVIIDVNPAFTTMFGYEREELLGHQVIETLFAPEYHAQVREKVRMRETRPYEAVGLRRDGSRFPVEIEARQVTPQLRVASVRDITHRKQAEAFALENERLRARFNQEQEQNALIQRMVSGLSHDLRTPLAVIASTKDMLSRYFDRMEPEKRQKKLDSIERQLQYAIELLDDTMTLVKGNVDQRPFNPLPVNLAVLCQVSLDEISEADHTGHRLIFKNPGQVGTVSVDEVLVSRILLNLLSNSIKYSPDGSEICLELDRCDDCVVLRVSDQGIGITAEDIPHIFDPFYRASNAKHIKGTGLGLSIVKDCAERHQGCVSITRQQGQGTVVTVELPIVEQPVESLAY